MNPKKVTIQSYDRTVSEYIKQVDPLHPESEAKLFLSLIPKDSTILDLGCGPGRDSKIFSDKGYKVTGVDLSGNMIAMSKKRVPGVIFKVMDIMDLKFKEHSFDGIWASASLLHVPKKDFPKTLNNINGILKPGGIFYLSVKKGKGEGLERDKRYDNAKKFWSYFSKGEIDSLIRKAGFRIVKSYVDREKRGYVTHPWICVFCRK